MKGKLPKNWKWIKLKDVCNNASSNLSLRKLENDNGNYPVYGAKGFIKNISFYHQDNDYISIIKDGAGVGRLKMIRGKSSVIGTLQYLLPKDNIDIKYLYYFLLGIDFEKYISGSTIPHIYYRHYKKEEFLFTPRQEQEKIVKVLDATFIKINKAIALVEQNITKLKQLNESVLDEVLLNNDWDQMTLEELTSKIGSGSTPRGGRSSYKVSGISLIRSMNVHDNGFKEKGLAFIDDDQAKKLSNVTIEKNDVLLNITGASVARCCIVPESFLPARVNQHVSILRSRKELILPAFLHLCLISPFYKNKLIIASGGGATREAITKTAQCSFKIKFPSIKKQLEVVSILTQIRTNNHAIIKHYQNKLQSLQDLKKSVLDSAFKGKLRCEVVKETKVITLPFYQMQLLGLSIQANKQDNVAQGEMAIAKDMYLLDRIYDVPTQMNFVNHSWGPFAPILKKRINNKQFFGKKNFPNSPATYFDTLNDNILLGKVNPELKKQVYDGIQDLNAKIFLKVEKYKRAEIKELLATVLKCMEDTKSTDTSDIRVAMQNWKIKQGKFKTKADKFTENETVRVIQFTKKMKWDLKVIN